MASHAELYRPAILVDRRIEKAMLSGGHDELILTCHQQLFVGDPANTVKERFGDFKEQRRRPGMVSDFTMRERMRRTLDMEESPAWDGSAYRPDIVVIKLGSNDFSTGIAPAEKPFNDSYARAIDYLRSIWGQVPILCVAPSDNTVVLRYLEQLIAERQDANLHFTAILPGVTNWDSDMGANYHPNHHGHRKLAMSVIPYIATITGWELPDTSVE